MSYNDNPEVVTRCSAVKKGTPEECRANLGLIETIKVLQAAGGGVRDLISFDVLTGAGMVLKLEWLTSGELHYRIGGPQNISADQTYDPATSLVSAAASPTPLPTPVSPLPVHVRQQVFWAQTAWSPDGQTLAVASCYAGCRLELLNPTNLSSLWSVDLKYRLKSLSFSPDGKSLAILSSSTYAGTLTKEKYTTSFQLFNVPDGALIWQVNLVGGSATDFEFSPNGANIAVLLKQFTNAPGEIWFLDRQNGKDLRKWNVEGAASLSYSPSGEQIVTTGEKLTLWNVSSGVRRWEIDLQKFTEQSGGACQIGKFDQAWFSPGQAFLFARGTGSDCSDLLALNLETQKLVSLQNEPNPDGPSQALYFDEQTSELVFTEPSFGLRRWKIDSQEDTQIEQDSNFFFGKALNAAVYPQKALMAFSTVTEGEGSFYTLVLFDLPGNKWLDLMPGPSEDWKEFSMTSLAFSPDGRWLAAANENGRLRVWEIPYIPLVAAAAEPNSSPTPLPPTVFSCPLAPSPRVKVGDTARITFTTGQKTRLRSIPEAGDNVIVMSAEGTEFKIIDGPRCYLRPGTNQAYVYWKIFVTSNSQAGWLAEGDSDSYFIEPLSH